MDNTVLTKFRSREDHEAREYSLSSTSLYSGRDLTCCDSDSSGPRTTSAVERARKERKMLQRQRRAQAAKAAAIGETEDGWYAENNELVVLV